MKTENFYYMLALNAASWLVKITPFLHTLSVILTIVVGVITIKQYITKKKTK